MLAITFVALLGASTSSLSPGYVFVTTAQGNGELDSWSEAGGNFGTAAGDAICRTEAGNAGVPDAGSYVAALSDSSNDMFCRLNGLGGKYPFCGQASPPSNAGPWLRRDGAPFATLAMLNGFSAITPVIFAADGTAVSSGATYFTGSEATVYVGFYTSSAAACSDWIAGDGTFTSYGESDGASQYWSYVGTNFCSSSQHLMCMKSGASAPFAYAKRSGRIEFATHASGNGDLSTWAEAGTATGIAAGDAICQSEAATYGFSAPSSFKAWLSDTANSINAIDRFQNDGPWVRSDGLPVSVSRAALASGSLASQPGLDPTGTFTSFNMMTGTTNQGLSTGSDCNGWTSADPTVMFTQGAGNVIGQWAQDGDVGCNSPGQRLYCFSDLDRIFDSSLEIAPY
jgi:hypothetical protein